MTSRDARASAASRRTTSRRAVGQGRRARALLLAILDAGGARAASGEAQFIAVQGGVEFRRGEQGEWETARSRDVLHSGDFVKTAANGSAEIVFLDGTLYTVRPNTLFLVTRARNAIGAGSEQAISMEYGWVDLNTAQRGGRVDDAVGRGARGARQRGGGVVRPHDRDRRASRLSAASVEVDLEGRRHPQGRAARGDPPEGRPADRSARPAAGAGGRSSRRRTSRRTSSRTAASALAWQPVQAASRYALQVSRSRLFVDNLIDVDARTKTAGDARAARRGNLRVAGRGDLARRPAGTVEPIRARSA